MDRRLFTLADSFDFTYNGVNENISFTGPDAPHPLGDLGR